MDVNNYDCLSIINKLSFDLTLAFECTNWQPAKYYIQKNTNTHFMSETQ